MTRGRLASTCPEPGCPRLAPCPDHGRQPFDGATGADRRAARGIPGTGWAEQQRNRTTIRANRGRCWWCGQPGATDVDHVIELADGGTDTPNNRKPIHPKCHTEKTAAARRRRERGSSQ